MSDREPEGPDSPEAPPESGGSPPAIPTNYQTVLRDAIGQVRNDPAHMRALVYELARINLKREALKNYHVLERAEAERQLAELEHAIRQVEADIEAEDRSGSFRPPPALIEPPPPRVQELILPERPPRWLDSRGRVSLEPSAQETTPARASSRAAAGFNAVLQFIGTAAIGVIVFAIVTGQLTFGHLFGSTPPAPPIPAAAPAATSGPPAPAGAPQTPPQAEAQVQAQVPPPAPPAPDLPFPLPTSYGVYAVNDGRLYELESLPIKVPDPRIQMSAEITTPSVTTVPGENLTFVYFRRELTNAAPARVPIRVVAQVLREMTFKGGAASVTPVEGTWRIRSSSLDLRVTPVPNHREIVTIQPDAGLTLPPGRYVLVLGGTGYDFTVAGSPVSVAHCLESFESSNGPMFSECRQP